MDADRGRVYADLLAKAVTTITEEQFAQAALGYERGKPVAGGKAAANGQASRGRADLSPVLDWAAGRKSFSKIGASHLPKLAVVSLLKTHSPAARDLTITRRRDRVLAEDELKRILPLLTYPAPKLGNLRLAPAQDYRLVAMRFLLFAAARRSFSMVVT